jgi:hypothetical protein
MLLRRASKLKRYRMIDWLRSPGLQPPKVHVCGDSTYPLIDRLLEMDIPVILYTGSEIPHDPQKYAKLPRVAKPSPCRKAFEALIRQIAL